MKSNANRHSTMNTLKRIYQNNKLSWKLINLCHWNAKLCLPIYSLASQFTSKKWRVLYGSGSWRHDDISMPFSRFYCRQGQNDTETMAMAEQHPEDANKTPAMHSYTPSSPWSGKIGTAWTQYIIWRCCKLIHMDIHGNSEHVITDGHHTTTKSQWSVRATTCW